jgi:hypothetical protein
VVIAKSFQSERSRGRSWCRQSRMLNKHYTLQILLTIECRGKPMVPTSKRNSGKSRYRLCEQILLCAAHNSVIAPQDVKTLAYTQ